MQIYLVGGAVRDQLLGLPVSERDWVVVGATPEQMIAQGFQPVGKEFPVFLHPKTKEEYALARTERKVGKGYKGFVFYADASVTLLQDLQRRDLTVNAIAQTADGELIDPYHGIQDLHQRLLRHVSPAFAEDPVRILRVARFAATFPDFTIHQDTYSLMRQMVAAGEVDALVAERVWQELQRSLSQPAPLRFWQVLIECAALPVLFPPFELTVAAMSALRNAADLTPSQSVRLAALWHELCPAKLRHLCQHYRMPRQYAELALLMAQFLPDYDQILSADALQLWQLLKATDAIRRPDRFAEFLLACQACSPQVSLHAGALLQQAREAVLAVDTHDLQAQGLAGVEFAQALKQLQLAAITTLLDQLKKP